MTRRLVIIGGGFGGLTAAKALRRSDVAVTLIDRTNHHLFQPLLYQVATGGLSPADIAAPIRHVLRRQKNTNVVMDTVTDIDPARKLVIATNNTYEYDTLIVATGAMHHYFGNDQWEANAPGLKTLQDATELRARILSAFEDAERTNSDTLNFVVIGGGPTGVEMAGAIAEMANHSLKNEFRTIDPSAAHVILVEAGEQILNSYPPDMSERAVSQLERLGVDVRTNTRVTDISDGTVTVSAGHDITTLTSGATIWAAGVKASPVGAMLQEHGANLDRTGRVVVGTDLSVFPDVFVIGDLAAAVSDGEPVPGVAPAAMQMAEYVVKIVLGRTTDQFRYRNKGNLATIGRNAGLAHFGKIKLSGWLAWISWLFIHILFLIGFQNRLLVLLQWTGNYFTRNRSARLIVNYKERD